MASVLTRRHVSHEKTNEYADMTTKVSETDQSEQNESTDDSSERLATLGEVDSNGNRELTFLPRKNVPWYHELLGNGSIFILSVWWVFGCICPGIIVLLVILGWYVSALVLVGLTVYPMVVKVQPWPLFRWYMAKGGHPLDMFAKKGYCITFQNGAYEAIARRDPTEFLSKASLANFSKKNKENESHGVHKNAIVTVESSVSTSTSPVGGNATVTSSSSSTEETTVTTTESTDSTDSTSTTEKNPVLLSYHPHGVFPIGYYLSGACCEPLFRVNPNIRFLIASTLFKAPIWKFLVAWLDKFDSAEKPSMTHLMANKADIALLPGGFEEATIYEHGVHRIYLKKRTGFIKYALQYGYTLVPVYTFGEELNYYNLTGFYKFRLWLNKFHIPGVVAVGKLGGLNFSGHAMNTIFGAPIVCPKIDNPTAEQVQEYHELYISNLQKLFDANKARCGNPDATLEIW